MTIGLLAIWVLVGMLAGRLAGVVMKDGGYGPKGDLILGLIGSIVGSSIFWALEVSPDAGLFTLVVVAFIGAAAVIGAQRMLWVRA